jgi:multidrug efflux pump
MRAALKGSEQIGFTIMSLTVSLIAVLIPLLFMSDVVGRLFREFAITLAVTILVSAFVSLTLTPMMCSRILQDKATARQTRFYHWSETCSTRSLRRTGVPFRWCCAIVSLRSGHHRHAGGTILLFIVVPKGFFPVQDTGVILGISRSAADGEFLEHGRAPAAACRRTAARPAVDNISSFIGVDGTNTTLNSGRIQINLKPLEDRKISATEVIRRMQPHLAGVEGIQLFLQPLQDLTVEDRVSRTEFQYSLEDPNQEELAVYTRKMVDELSREKMVTDVASDLAGPGPGRKLVIDRDTAARLGIAMADVDNTLYDAFGQRQVSTILRSSTNTMWLWKWGRTSRPTPAR